MQVQTIAEQLLFTTVHTTCVTNQGVGFGTSFIFHVPMDGGVAPFLVTNKHVIKGAKIGRLVFTKRSGEQPMIGNPVTINVEDFADRWHQHPDPEIDVAVMPIAEVVNLADSAGQAIYYRSITESLIPTEDQMASLDAIEDVVFIGYPNGIFDQHNLLPIVRKGITATHIQIDYNGQPLFLIDASVFPGSSGSPVFVLKGSGHNARDGGFRIGSPKIYFVGILASVLYQHDHGKLEFVSIPTVQEPIVKIRRLLNLGCIFKARVVRELISDFMRTYSSAS